MKIGYARVSTEDQNLDAQIDALERVSCDRIFKEKISATKSDRPELAAALSHLRKGDTLVVYKLDRLGRSLKQLIELVEGFKDKGIHFQSLAENIDTSSPAGVFFFQIIGGFAELERSLIVERTRAGLSAARARGRLGGRPEKIKRSQKELAYEMYIDKKNIRTVDEIIEPLGMSRMTFYRYLNQKNSGGAA